MKWHIFIWIYHLIVTWIVTHTFVPSFSIFQTFSSHLKLVCCFLLLGKLVPFFLQQSKTYIQHHLYTIFEKIFSFNDFILSHTWLQYLILTTRVGIFIFQLSGQQYVCIVIGSRNWSLKAPSLSYRSLTCRDWWKMGCMFPRVRYQCLEGIPHISEAVSGAWAYLTVWSTIRSIILS